MSNRIWFSIAGFAAITTVVFQTMYTAQPRPFIDEIFHIPQAKQYCSGNFKEWDPKITTLPGMYIASFLTLLPVSLLKGNACTVWSLRYFNVICNTLNMVLIFFTVKEINKRRNIDENGKGKDDGNNLVLTTFAIGLVPVLYFFSFLYYTDPGSTMFVLAAYLACLKGNNQVAAVLSALSIVFRQSNIIWTVFMAGSVVANHMDGLEAMEKIKTSPEVKDKLLRFFANMMLFIVRYLLVIENVIVFLHLLWPYIIVILMFAAFVFFNNGIVVGDRSSHEAVLHLSQFLYYSGFVLFSSAPLLISSDKVKRFIVMAKQRSKEVLFYSIIMAYVLTWYSYAHPYLLADNRHYVFYIWRWFLGGTVVKYFLIPVYMYALWSMNDSLTSSHSFLWKVVLFVCTAAALVPQKLLEFRYFILPYLFFRLNTQVQSRRTLLLEVLLHILVNAFTIAVFLGKTFSWPDLAEPQRIIW